MDDIAAAVALASRARARPASTCISFGMLGDLLRRTAARAPDSVAFIDRDRRMTYADWDRTSDIAGARLAALGVRPGDVIAVLLDASASYPIVFLGAAKVGAVTAGINPRLGPREIEHIVTSSGARLVVADRDAPGRIVDANDVLAGDDSAPQQVSVSVEDPVAIVYTSGTTGLPKGATYTAGALDAVRRIEMSLGDWPPPVGIQGIPMAHMGFMTKIAAHIDRCATTVLMHGAWSARAALEAVERERVTSIGGIPTQLQLMLMDPDFANFDLASLRSCLIGGAPASPDLVRTIREGFGVPVFVRYSCTELGLATGTRAGDSDRVIARTVGRPMPEVDLRIAAANDDGVGEILVRSPAMMRGYWNDPDATRAAIDADGFFHTGDLGQIDADGNLRLAGRSKDMYIRGGYNIYPVEVEDVLREHPDVALAAVVGVPDPVLGERGKAFIVPRDAAAPPSEQALKMFIAERIADYKVPDIFEFRDELPLTPMFKVDKRALVAQEVAT